MNLSTQSREIYNEGRLSICLKRLAQTLVEKHFEFRETALVGLQPRGVYLSRRLLAILRETLPDSSLEYGELDATFFRDDFRNPIGGKKTPNETKINFLVENKNVILIDDVLYTGRSVRAALDALLTFGRPARVELLVLVERKRKRELPIEPNYVGVSVETLDVETVVVEWKEKHGIDAVRLQTLSI